MGKSDTSARYRDHAVGAMLRVAFPLLGVFLLTMGMVGTVSYGILPAFDALRSRNWVPVVATLESVAVVPPVSALHPPLDRIEIRYRYVFDKVEYVGGRLDPNDGRYSERRSKAVADRLRNKAELQVWVNPADPHDTLVERELRAPIVLFVLPALAMVVAGSISLFAGMLAWNNMPPAIRRRGADPR